MKKFISLAAAVLLLPISAFANTITDTQSISDGGAGSVAYTYFNQDAAEMTVIQTQTDNFDAYMYLFYDNGPLDSTDFITFNDDGGASSAYGYSNAEIARFLYAGSYVVAVSDYDLTLSDAISGINTNIDSFGVGYGAYDLQISSEANVSLRADSSTVPEPASIALFGLGLIGMGFSRRKA